MTDADYVVRGPYTYLDPDIPQRIMRCAGCKGRIDPGYPYMRCCVGIKDGSLVHVWHPRCWDRKVARLRQTALRRQARRTARFYRQRGQ